MKKLRGARRLYKYPESLWRFLFQGQDFTEVEKTKLENLLLLLEPDERDFIKKHWKELKPYMEIAGSSGCAYRKVEGLATKTYKKLRQS